MSKNLEKLQALLAELFQFDHADLDFGIYRIMNSKRDEITRFLNDDLLPQVKEAFLCYQSADKAKLEADVQEAVQQAAQLGVNPDDVPRVKELREKLKSAVDVKALEEEVYSHLANFFRRYYQEGDFLSLRRYKEGVYAIPYEGEEVKLHWANHDQYYVKTSEYFRDYAFKLASGKRVHFELVEADTEKDNIKEEAGKERRFILCAGEPYRIENDELVLRFEYRPDAEKRKQADLNQAAVSAIRAIRELRDWLPGLAERSPTDKNETRTLLEKHLTDYTARNTFDYFIHKDLGGFLRRELDFYIKNEIMHLDDIQEESTPKVEEYLSKIKVIRQIAHKIIEFLAQIENFQKKLWLKKKFVVETNYCITLDRVPEELYPEIAANDAQQEEWVKLFAIDEIKADLVKPGYTVPLTLEFLKANDKLVMDTQFFDPKFKSRLIASLEQLDEQCEGLLIQADNFHGLAFLQQRYKGGVSTVYIDPPYNTAGSEIAYKNEYKHSSWLSLIDSRMGLARGIMESSAIMCVAIDDAEAPFLAQLLMLHFGEENHLATVPIRSKPQGRAVPAGFSPNHEYALFYRFSESSEVGRLPRDEKKMQRYRESDEHGDFAWSNFRGTGANSWRTNRPKLYYPIYVSHDGEIVIPDFQWHVEKNMWVAVDKVAGLEAVLPIDEEGTERVWTFGWNRAKAERSNLLQARKTNGNWQIYRKYRAKREGALPGTWWDDPKYSASESGTKVLKDLFPGLPGFSYPKSIHTVVDCLRVCNLKDNDCVLDYFAGSGTTGHAVVNLNREDDGMRRYILIEMGDYFDKVLKPRVAKVVYSESWDNGTPIARQSGVSHAFKYLVLESYDDALCNIQLKRTDTQQWLLNDSKDFKESYLLTYMLDTESKESPSLLNVSAFEDPFNYKLKVGTGSVGETKLVNVDLVETFNYLIGLTVRHIDWIRGYCVVQGTNPKNEKVLVIWRNTKEKTNEDLEKFFRKQEYNPKDMEFDLIYVNGDNNLENIRREDETWKVRLIEEDFFRLMFEVEDI